MATYYVDFKDGFDSNNGTSASTPVKTWNAANIGSGTFNPGDVLLFKEDVVYYLTAGRIAPAFSSSPTQLAPFIISSYGPKGTRAIFDGGFSRDIGIRPAVSIDQANGPRYVTIDNIEVKNCTLNGISIAEVLDTGVTDAFNTVKNCYIHHITGNSNAGLTLYGTGVKVLNNTITDIAGDGMLVRGSKVTIVGNYIARVSNTNAGLGDGIQLDGGLSGALVSENTVHRENTDKQGILVKCNNAVVCYNNIYGLSSGAGLLTIFESGGCSVFGNLLVGVDGIYILDSNAPNNVFGNLLIGTYSNVAAPGQTPPGQSTGIDCGTTYTHIHKFYNNTVINYVRGIFARNVDCQNNIVLNCSGTGIDTTGNTTGTENYNCSFGNGTNFSTAPGANSLQVNPQLNSLYAPQNSTVASGGNSLLVTDFNGKMFRSPFTMGAILKFAARTVGNRTITRRAPR